MPASDVPPFVIPPRIASDFVVVGDLSRADEWKARVRKANSGSAKIGSMEEIGYVLISLDSPAIVPVARSDEHHCGYDLLDHYLRRRMVPREEYVAVFCFGANFVWPEGARRSLEAFRRFRAYGGRNSVVRGTNEAGRYAANMDDFIEGRGSLAVAEGVLSPIGRHVVARLEEIGKGVVAKRRDVFAVASTFASWIAENGCYVGKALDVDIVRLDEWEKEALRAEAEEDHERLASLFFTMTGIKNSFHNRLRAATRKATEHEFQAADARDFWGDLDAAMAEFERLGQI
jgi:hypothetical protein